MMNDYELDTIHTEYLEKIEKLVKEHYMKTHNYQPQLEIMLANGDIFSFSKALVPVHEYTHIAKVHTVDGETLMYARALTAEEKKNAPDDYDWEINNQYAKLYK